MKKGYVVGLATGLMLLGCVAGANADPFQGQLWEGTSAATTAADNATPTNFSVLGTPTATFTVNSINAYFNSSATYETFLGGPSNVTWLTGGSIQNSTIVSSTSTGTAFEFTGTAYFAADTGITHDDGFSIILLDPTTHHVDLTILNGSETTAETTYLGNTAGVYSFELFYGAANGFPEVIQAPITPTPEPATMVLFGFGLAGFAGLRLRKKA
ncbi:MAG: PEP-CTERM sorting domain-containing protein [Desulfocapsaceae bacterium]|nr:PEP-CTERM sorting domain-containing protein [Desulfocapsaceae bacterium]